MIHAQCVPLPLMSMFSSFKRREFLAATAALAVLPSGALARAGSTAAPGAQSDGLAEKPFDRIVPAIAADSSRVRLLFTYDCPFCRSYHNGLVQWGATLPSPLRFEATPVLTSSTDNLVMAVYGRLIMQGIAPSKVHVYDYSMYTQIQGDPDSGQMAKAQISPEDILRTIATASGVPGTVVRDYLGKHSATLERRLPDHAALIKSYGLKATPAVAVAGKITVTPDHAGGSPQQYLLLLNAMVSRAIQGGLDAI